MKSYKLIKEYPGSPEKGTIAWVSKEHFNQYVYNNHFNSTIVIKEEVLSYSAEFWQLIEEKEYEILSVSIGKYRPSDIYENGKFKWSTDTEPKFITLKKLQTTYRDTLKIHSVKRLSDGEVFTVGDKFDWKHAINNSPLEIIDFKIRGNYLEVGYYSKDKYYYSINHIQKAKQPLFTTEDGVEIFENNTCYFVRSSLEKVEKFDCNNSFWLGNLMLYKWFSTKEAAEEYIIYNKPCLSIKDIESLITRRAHEEKLRNLVKTKLK